MPEADDRAVRNRRHGLRVFGVFAVALFLLATSKWGSYLPFTKPPYVSDIGLGVVAAHRFLFGAHRPGPSGETGAFLRGAVTAFLFWCLIELVRGPLSLTAVRDAAPYLYAVAVFLVAAPAASATRRMERAVTAALVFHAGWCTLAIAAPRAVAKLPLLAGQIGVLQPRSDFDGAVCGIFAALSLHRALSGRRIARNLALAAWNGVLVLYLKERAGLLALVVALVVVLLLSPARLRLAQAARAKPVVPVLLILVPVLAALGSGTPAYQRLLASVHTYVPAVHASAAYANTNATQHARVKAWRQVGHWMSHSTSRELAGIGFGPDFMHESGADILLVGGTGSDVRSPHNYFVGTYARLGAVGVGLDVVVLGGGVVAAVRLRRRASALSDVDVLAMLVLAGLPTAGAVGVILESPFGAVPLFWAIGHLLARGEPA